MTGAACPTDTTGTAGPQRNGMEENVSLLAAFGAGLLSFISPCVLPLIPGYLSYISGLSLDEMRGTAVLTAGGSVAVGAPPDVRRRILISSAAFILGFTLVFVAIGASASAIGHFVGQRLPLLGRFAGIVIVLFGLHTMGVLRIEWLYQEKRLQSSRRPAGPFGAMLVGIAFAFGWTPCIGPILSGILLLAGSQETVGQGVRLLTAYSLGLGVPFFATALAINRFFAALARVRHHYHKIEVASGALLVAIGVLIFTNKFTIIAQWLTPYLPVY
jgi:cytochrome c-type biogenesis protein